MLTFDAILTKPMKIVVQDRANGELFDVLEMDFTLKFGHQHLTAKPHNKNMGNRSFRFEEVNSKEFVGFNDLGLTKSKIPAKVRS